MASYPGVKATIVTGDAIGKIKAGKVRPPSGVPPSNRAHRSRRESPPNLIDKYSSPSLTPIPLSFLPDPTGGDRRGREEGA